MARLNHISPFSGSRYVYENNIPYLKEYLVWLARRIVIVILQVQSSYPGSFSVIFLPFDIYLAFVIGITVVSNRRCSSRSHLAMLARPCTSGVWYTAILCMPQTRNATVDLDLTHHPYSECRLVLV